MSATEKLVRVRRIQVQPLRLPIRTMRTTDVRAFVPVKPEPAQILEDAGLRFTSRSLDIGILDAQDECAVLAARQQPVEKRGARVAHVQLAGGAWRESDSH